MLEIIRNSVEEITLTSKAECQKFIGEYLEKNRYGEGEGYRMYQIEKVLRERLLPHIGTDSSEFRRKGFFIGYMTNKLLSAFLGKADENDRDHYGKKRCDIAGDLLTLLFRDRFVKNYLSNGQKILQKMFNDGKNIGSDTRI